MDMDRYTVTMTANDGHEESVEVNAPDEYTAAVFAVHKAEDEELFPDNRWRVSTVKPIAETPA